MKAAEESSESEEEGVFSNMFSFFGGAKNLDAKKKEDVKTDASLAANEEVVEAISEKPVSPGLLPVAPVSWCDDM